MATILFLPEEKGEVNKYKYRYDLVTSHRDKHSFYRFTDPFRQSIVFSLIYTAEKHFSIIFILRSTKKLNQMWAG